MDKIMVVEDEPPIARYICRLLEQLRLEYQVVAVGGNGEEGLELFMEHRPDIVISDVRMPGISGLEMLEKIKKLDEQVQFLIISDYQDFEYARDGLRLGVHNYLIKPVTLEQLQENLSQIRQIMKKDREQTNVLQELIGGRYENREIVRLKGRSSCWQLVWIQYGCVMNSRMKYLIHSEERAGIGTWKIEKMTKHPEYVAACEFQKESNSVILLWNAQKVPFQKEMLCENQEKMMRTVVVSPVYAAIKKTSSFYAKCSKFIYYQVVIGKDRFVEYDEAMMAERIYRMPREQKYKLTQCMEMNQFERIKQELLTLVSDWEQEEMPQYLVENTRQSILFLWTEKRKITMEQQQEGMAEIIYFSRTMSDVLVGILDLIQNGWEIEEEEGNKKRGEKVMRAIDKHIETHLGEVFTLQDLSDAFHLSKTYICRLFRDYKEMSFKDYMIEIKMEKAKDLLENGENVKTVAEYLGYIDPFYFSKIFKKKVGTAPSEYSKRGQKT